MITQLESIRFKLAGIAKDVISEDKDKLVLAKICSKATLYKYLVQDEGTNYTICRNIYLFLSAKITERQNELDKI